MKLFFQQMMAFLVMTVTTLIIFGLVFIQFTTESTYRNKWHLMQQYADSIYQQSVILDSKANIEDIDVGELQGIERLLDNQHIHFTIYTTDGRTIHYPNQDISTRITKQQWKELKAGNSLKSRSKITVAQGKKSITMTELDKPYFNHDGEMTCVISVGSPLSNIQADIKKVENNLMATLFFVMIVAIVFSYFLSRYLVSRLEGIRKAAHQVSQGDFNVHLKVDRKDEIGQLQQDFNLMTDSLRESDEEIIRQEQRRRAFMADAAHEMRTPLTTINGILEGLEYDAIPEESKKDSISLMQKETKRLIRLVNDNLDYERIRTNKIKLKQQNLKLYPMVSRIVKQLNEKATASGDQIKVKIDENIDVFADYDRLVQILFNVIQNAIQFTENGLIEIEAKQIDSNTVITIADNGIGMTDEQIKNIWERYYKADASRIQTKGESGLGMAIVHELVKVHGGDITVESQPGMGSKFIIKMPSNKK